MEKGVCAFCTAYNHANYIREALEGFVSQNVDFPYKVIVHDDASTDGTADIVKEYAEKYPNIIIPILQKENQYSKGLDIYREYIRKYMDYKYLAICEGDDYWSDNNKLMKQYHYMEENPDVSLCVHNTLMLKNDGTVVERNNFHVDSDISLEMLLKEGPGKLFHTSSYMIRTELYDYPNELIIPGVGDYNVAVYAAIKGRIHYIDKIMSCYRVGVGNSWSQRIIHNDKNRMKHYRDMSNFYLSLNDFTHRKYNELCIEQAVHYKKEVIFWENTLIEAIFSRNIRKEIRNWKFENKRELYARLLKKMLHMI